LLQMETKMESKEVKVVASQKVVSPRVMLRLAIPSQKVQS
jgi:hypothetical protein